MSHPTPASVERLAAHLFDGELADPVAEAVVAWLRESSRFRAFVDRHRDKVRKKLRSATDDEARRDVRTELRIAHLLLADRRIELAFEAYGAGRGGPDFTVAFRGRRSVNLEVTRMRRDPAAANAGGPLLTKVRQLPPGIANVLLVAVEGERADALDVAGGVRALRARADAKDEAFFTRRGFDGSRAFYDRFLRLGAVITWCEDGRTQARASCWMNPSARIVPSERPLRAILDRLRA